MTGARDEMLRRVRTALADRPAPAPVARDYRAAGSRGPAGQDEYVDLFAERVDDYKATVVRCTDDDLAATLATFTAGRVGVAPDLPDGLRPADPVVDDPPLSAAELDVLDAVLTTCAVAIADTGTIVLDHGPGQGRRALTLVPDRHVVVVRAAQVVPGVPDAVAALDPTRPLTWISGPSATSDIELDRVEGVHGPRTLQVVLVG